MKPLTTLSRWVLHLVCGAQLLGATAFIWFDPTRQQPTPTRHSFTQQDVIRIEKALQGTDPSTYRLILPAFANGRVVGSKTYGSLTMAQVRRVASRHRLTIPERGTMQLVMDNNAAGESSGESTTNPDPGPGPDPNPENTEAGMQPTRGDKLARLLDAIVRNIDQKQYVFLKASSAIGKQKAAINQQKVNVRQ